MTDQCEQWEQVTFFEPRWHGFARWEHVLYTPIGSHLATVEVLGKGWVRRPRGSECRSFSDTNARIADLEQRLREIAPCRLCGIAPEHFGHNPDSCGPHLNEPGCFIARATLAKDERA